MKLKAPFSDRDLLAHIESLPHGRAAHKHLVRELGAKGQAKAALEDALDRLAARGDIVEFKGGNYAATANTREFAAGRLHMHRDGFGFVTPDKPLPGMRGDIFIPPASAEQAMHGDRVLVRVGRVDSDGKVDGEILKILRRAHPTIVGEFHSRKRGNWVKPHDDRIKQWVYIPDGMETPKTAENIDRVGVNTITEPEDGMVVNVEIIEYPEDGDDAVGRVVEILGYPDDFGVDVEIIIRKFHLPHHFDPDVINQARAIPVEVPAGEIARREDFRQMAIVTIDGETARDFDDAVWIERLPSGNYRLDVHIADVSHYVKPGSPIDREAFDRGTSVYFPDRAVPMLPLELSTEICSLKPGVDRLVVSALLELDPHGDVVSQRFTRGVIRSAARMTYTKVHGILEGDAALREEYAALAPNFELMRELALILNRKRTKRGSIDFDLPEAVIEFDKEGAMTGVRRSERNIANRIIEEFMLAANEAVASHLESLDVPSLYRIHETPDPKKILEFEEAAARFGHSLGFGAMPVKRFGVVERKRDGSKVRRDVIRADDTFKVSSRMYQKLVAKLEGKAEERIVSQLMLRSLKQARYSEMNTGHFALAAASYTHFTSPIRRYPDLVVHRILTEDWRSGEDVLHAIADQSSERERTAAEAERELMEWKKVKYMMARVGEDFSAAIVSTTKFGFFVELEDLYIEGLVPIDTLPGERWIYQENTRTILGPRTRREFRIGDKVRVLLDRVDGIEKKLQFAWLSGEEEGPRPVRRGSRR